MIPQGSEFSLLSLDLFASSDMAARRMVNQAGAAFAKDVPLMCGIDGTAVAHDGNGSHLPIGRSVCDAQAGEVVSVWLTPCAGVPVNAP